MPLPDTLKRGTSGDSNDNTVQLWVRVPPAGLSSANDFSMHVDCSYLRFWGMKRDFKALR